MSDDETYTQTNKLAKGIPNLIFFVLAQLFHDQIVKFSNGYFYFLLDTGNLTTMTTGTRMTYKMMNVN